MAAKMIPKFMWVQITTGNLQATVLDSACETVLSVCGPEFVLGQKSHLEYTQEHLIQNWGLISEMTRLSKIAVIAVSLTAFGVSLFEVGHLVRFGHLAPFGLHADVLTVKADYGIQGITKVYEGKLINYGFVPTKITACDFVDDAGTRGTIVGYRIEKWDTSESRWRNIFKNDDSNFCHPYPLGISQAHIITKRLWLGQSISAGEEATAARDAFVLGDNARFVLFAGKGLAYPTAAFTIDEHPLIPDVPLRVRH